MATSGDVANTRCYPLPSTAFDRRPIARTDPPATEDPQDHMAKRARGTTTRPGQRRPIQRPAARPASAAPRPSVPAAPATDLAAIRPASLTPEEEARAAELEAAIVAEERQAEQGRRARAPRTVVEPVARAGSSLAVAAANEYAYVSRDVRRVAIVGGSLLGILLALWVVVQVTGITL